MGHKGCGAINNLLHVMYLCKLHIKILFPMKFCFMFTFSLRIGFSGKVMGNLWNISNITFFPFITNFAKGTLHSCQKTMERVMFTSHLIEVCLLCWSLPRIKLCPKCFHYKPFCFVLFSLTNVLFRLHCFEQGSTKFARFFLGEMIVKV